MASGKLLLLYAALSIVGLQLVEVPVASAQFDNLSKGFGPYLQQQDKYSLFYRVLQKLSESTNYKDSTTGWFKGPTNQTLLVVTDDNLRKDYAQVAKQYNISNPDTFIDRLIDIADGSIDPRHSSSPVYTKANWAAFALLAFAGSHTLPAPYDFYSNQTILNAPYDRPANLTTSITGFYSYTGNLQAYYENRALAPSVVYLRQEGGLQHVNDGLEVPRSYLTGSGTNGASDGSQQGSETATAYVYELNGILLLGDNFGFADESGHGGDLALKYLAQNGI